MLRGELVGLRARTVADGLALHAYLHGDVDLWSRAHGQPWGPIDAESEGAPFAPGTRTGNVEVFSVVTLSDGELVGDAVMWGIDEHNRCAHLGLSVIPPWHGRGIGSDVVAVLCHYGFVIRGLHRLAIETLADNEAMIGAARRSGFVHEGTMRDACWVSGSFRDEVTYALLAPAYQAM